VLAIAALGFAWLASGCGGINSTGTLSPLMFIQRGNGNPAPKLAPAQPARLETRAQLAQVR